MSDPTRRASEKEESVNRPSGGAKLPPERGDAAINAGHAGQVGNDDIARGNVGTGDQGPADIYPEEPVTADSGKLPRGESSPPVHPPHRQEHLTEPPRREESRKGEK